MTVNGIDVLHAILTDAHDGGDEWGSTMLALFSFADALRLRGEMIPDEWQYRHSAPDDEEREREESYVLDMTLSGYDAGDLTGDDIRAVAETLRTKRDQLRAAEKDY